MKKLAVITGASSGLGWEFAWLLAKDQYDLVVTARNRLALVKLKEELEHKYAIEVFIVEQDLAVKDGAKKIYDAVCLLSRPIDVLINNAGFGDYGYYHTLDWENQEAMIQVNILALMQLTRYVLADMVSNKRGYLMNVASTAAFQSGPLIATYYASKAYILSFTEAIATEVRDMGVVVSAFCPGPTRTRFVENANLETSRLKVLFTADAGQVAAYGYRMLKNGKVIAIPGWTNRLFMVISKFMPRRITRSVMYNLHRKKFVS